MSNSFSSFSTGTKRTAFEADLPSAEPEGDVLSFTPLGGGCEVGRSCHLLQYKGFKLLLDCGLHPAYNGLASLPYLDSIDMSEIDVILVTHFHLDHIAALPYITEKTEFQGSIFMTHPTKSIYKLILQDFIKVSTISVEEQLYDEEDLLRSMDKITTINYHQIITLSGGLRFWALNAGHVLGAAMFMIEIGSTRILYTGDYSRIEDRHLMAAELPSSSSLPHVLIIEATYGTQQLPPVEQREERFCSLVEKVVLERQGSVLIPVFALGRAQELLLILDEYWQSKSSLHHIPIYFASFLAKKCMDVYKTYLLMMNSHIQEASQIRNPFIFKHITNLKNLSTFDETQPCVILASPGMLQNGVSRELLELWCMEERHACIIAGYAVEGTLAKTLLSEPSFIQAMNGTKLPLKMSVHYISFSAHADYNETSEFISLLSPQHCILVHGDAYEGVGKLKNALQEKYREVMNVVGPKNLQTVEIEFKAVKIVKTMGSLASIDFEELSNQSEDGQVLIEGVLLRKDLNYTLIAVEDLPTFTPIAINTINQSLLLPWHQTYDSLWSFLIQLYDCEEKEQEKKNLPANAEEKTAEASSAHEPSPVTSHADEGRCILVTESVSCYWFVGQIKIEWLSSPIDDMIADSLISLLMNVQANPGAAKMIGVASHHDHAHHAHTHTPQHHDSNGAEEASTMREEHDHDQHMSSSENSINNEEPPLPAMLSSTRDSVLLQMPVTKKDSWFGTSSSFKSSSSSQAIIRLLESQFGCSQVLPDKGQSIHLFNIDGVMIHVDTSHATPQVRLVGAASVNDAKFASLVVDRMRRTVQLSHHALQPISKAEEDEEGEDEIVAQVNAPLLQDEIAL